MGNKVKVFSENTTVDRASSATPEVLFASGIKVRPQNYVEKELS